MLNGCHLPPKVTRPVASPVPRDGGELHPQDVPVRVQAREESISRLRQKRRADAELARAIMESERLAATAQHSMSADEEAAQIASAIEASLREVTSHQRPSCPPPFAPLDEVESPESSAKIAGETRCHDPVPPMHVVPCTIRNRRQEALPSSSTHMDVEEHRQIELAVAESLRTEAQRAADHRYHQSAVLCGLLDSLRPGGESSAASPADSDSCGAMAARRERDVGRAMAVHALEQELTSGAQL